MKRFLKCILLLPMILGISLFTVILIAFFWFPQILINQFTVTQALRLTDRYVMPVTWRDVDAQAESQSLWVKALNLKVDGLCLGLDNVTFCGEDMRLAAELQLRPGDFAIRHLGPVRLLGLMVEVRQSPDEVQEEAGLPDEPLRPLIWLETLEELTVDPVQVEIARLLVLSPENEALVDVSGSLTLTGLNRHLRHGSEQSTDQANLRVTGLINQQSANLDGKLEILNYRQLTDELASIRSQITGRWIEHRIDANFDISGQRDTSYRPATSRVRYRSELGNFQLDGKGRLSEGQFVGRLDAAALEITDQLFDLRLSPCDVRAGWGERFTDQMRLNMKCRGLASHQHNVNLDPELSRFLPSRITFEWSVEGEYQHGQESDAYQLISKLALNEIQNGGLRLAGNAQAQARKDFADTSPDFNIDLDFELAIQRFEALVEQLADTDWSIPAPLNQLRGDSACQVRGRYVSAMERHQFPVFCETSLASVRQALETRLDGRLDLIKTEDGLRPHLDADFEIINVEIALPDFSVGQQVPKIAPDDRFVLEDRPRRVEEIWQQPELEVEAPPELAFSYEVRVRSARDDAIRIHSNLLRVPLPLAANVDLTSERGMQGRIEIQEYRVELFRREALVQNVALNLEFDRVDHPISGRVLFDTVDYTIQLRILGTAESPTLVLESSPPLPEQDLYAILLFGSRPEALDSDKVRSLDETRAAITDGAIGLLSMYYLASTPIESVGYNPNDGMFTARVALQEGLTLTVGTDAGQGGEVGLRKRLGQNWSIETRAVSGDEERAGKAVAMLRWGLRY